MPPAMTTVRFAVRAAEAGGADELTEPGDQPDGRRRSKRGQVVLIHAIA